MANDLIVGGAGFIGVNAAKQYLQSGHAVAILDNRSPKEGIARMRAWMAANLQSVAQTSASAELVRAARA